MLRTRESPWRFWKKSWGWIWPPRDECDNRLWRYQCLVFLKETVEADTLAPHELVEQRTVERVQRRADEVTMPWFLKEAVDADEFAARVRVQE